MFGPLNAVVLEMLVERFDAHRADAFGDQIADRIIHHRGGDAGLQPEAIGQIGRDIEFAAADVNVALSRFAERNDSRIEPMHQRAERNEIGRRLVEYSSHSS